MYAAVLALRKTTPIWLRWVLGTETGYAFALWLLIRFLGRLFNPLPPPLFGACVGAVFGSCSGFAQSLVLKNRLKVWSGWWALATTAAWAAFWCLNTSGLLPRGDGAGRKVLEGLEHGALFGACLGFAQASLLGCKRNAVQWIIGNVLSWAFCAALADGAKAVLQADAPLEFIIALPLSALLTSVVLRRMTARLFFHL